MERLLTAGKEASGTGNMKLMLNGAVTFGTLDGANVEIFNEGGEENNFIFGLKVEEIEKLKETYKAKEYYDKDPALKRVIDTLVDGTFNDGGTGEFQDLFNSLIYENDKYFILADFQSFKETEDKVFKAYKDKYEWGKKGFINMCSSGKFSSDRTIMQYAEEIWHIKRSALRD